MKTQRLNTLALVFALAPAFGCGGETDRTGNPGPGPGSFDAGTMITDPPEGPTGKVTRCLGASCPRGECGFSNDCSAYEGFDALDSSAVCSAATGAKELCLKYEVPRDDGFVDIYEQAISCVDVTVVKRSCTAGCGYNYQPDDCVICNESNGCVFNQ